MPDRPRNFFLGPRFAFNRRGSACEACCFGRGEHATFCGHYVLDGMRLYPRCLRIDEKRFRASLVFVPLWRRPGSRLPVPELVSYGAAKAAVDLGPLGKLTEHRVDHKLGWRELGLDGSKADFYLFIQ